MLSVIFAMAFETVVAIRMLKESRLKPPAILKDYAESHLFLRIFQHTMIETQKSELIYDSEGIMRSFLWKYSKLGGKFIKAIAQLRLIIRMMVY
jgi:hypothetical protein